VLTRNRSDADMEATSGHQAGNGLRGLLGDCECLEAQVDVVPRNCQRISVHTSNALKDYEGTVDLVRTRHIAAGNGPRAG
jgi:hypothetical protein